MPKEITRKWHGRTLMRVFGRNASCLCPLWHGSKQKATRRAASLLIFIDRANIGERGVGRRRTSCRSLWNWGKATIWFHSIFGHANVTNISTQICGTCSSSTTMVGYISASNFHLVGVTRLVVYKVAQAARSVLSRKRRVRVLSYLEDFLAAPSRPGRTAKKRNIVCTEKMIICTLMQLGLSRNEKMWAWIGVMVFDHLEISIDTHALRVFVTETKVKRVRTSASALLLLLQRSRRLVPSNALHWLYGVTVSLTLRYQLASFYKRSLFSTYTKQSASTKRKPRSKSKVLASFENHTWAERKTQWGTWRALFAV